MSQLELIKSLTEKPFYINGKWQFPKFSLKIGLLYEIPFNYTPPI
jgi:hypothetical protein